MSQDPPARGALSRASSARPAPPDLKPPPASKPKTPDLSILPVSHCLQCGHRTFNDSFRGGRGSGLIYECACIKCGECMAQWLPGDTEWTHLYFPDGTRNPNPHNLPGYGLPDPEDEEVADAERIA